MNHTVLMSKMREMKLHGMLRAYQTTMEANQAASMTVDETLDYLIETEWNDRETRKLERRRSAAHFTSFASIDELDFDPSRSLDRNLVMRIAECSFIDRKENVIVTGSTGVGKSYLASAIGHQACSKGYKVRYFNSAKLFRSLRMSKADNSYVKMIKTIEKQDLIILDDFGLQPFDGQDRLALLEIIEDRQEKGSTVLASQLPVSSWHDIIGESTIADAILDRVAYSSHRFELSGHSMRKKRKKLT